MSEEKSKTAAVLAAITNPDKEAKNLYRRLNTACLIVITSVCITIALIYTKAIMVPLVISIFIYTMITPLVRIMIYKFRCPRWLATIMATLVVVIPLLLLVFFLINSITNFVQTAGIYRTRLLQMFYKILYFARGYERFFPEGTFEINTVQSLLMGPGFTNFLRKVGGSAFNILSYFLFVCIFLFFFLIGSSRKITNSVIKEIQNKISAYLYIHIIISVITGVLVWIVYFSAGIELALMFAALTVILNFIPNIGSIIAVVLPIPIAFMQFGFGLKLFVIVLIPSCIQLLIGSILEPKILGAGMDLHPVAIVGSLIFWGLVWGIPGAFLAVPITAAIRMILSKIEPTRLFAEILSGRLPK